jgi:N-ATPase, AtpR subunit
MDAATMTDLHLADFFPLPLYAGFGAGVLIGAAYFLTLRWTIQILALGQAALLGIGLQLARFAVLALALVLIARGFGAVSLVAVTAGILAARAAVLRIGAPA